MLPNRQLLISFLCISDKGIKGKEEFVTNLNSLDMTYILEHKTHQDFTRKIWGNNISYEDETQIHKNLFNKTAL
jgi:hypothetical protein